MFAFAGASTFPTIQADMRHKDQFPTSVKAACVSKLRLERFGDIFYFDINKVAFKYKTIQ